MSGPRIPEGERGAALLTVLLIVAIVGAIAAAAFERMRLATALSANAAGLQQARSFAMGIEALLLATIRDRLAQSDGAVMLDRAAERTIPLPGGGVAQGRVRDASTCFNLNSLVEGDPNAGTLMSRPAAIAQFAALMSALGIGQHRARNLAEAAADWADSNQSPNAAGAEDAAYAAEGYRTGDALFAEASELRAVAGVTAEDYARLRPLICALPVAEMSQINVNSLGAAQAPLLSMVVRGLSGDAARAAIAQRPAGGWRSSGDFWESSGVALIGASADAYGQLQTTTRWFALDLEVTVHKTRVVESALVDARRAVPSLHSRRWTEEE